MNERLYEVREVSISDLIPFSLQSSQAYPYQGERLEQLVSSIERVGLMTPIIVRHVADGKYEIICGRNRTKALEVLGRDVISAEVRTGITDDEAMELFYDSNLNQQSFSDGSYSEKIEAIKYTEKMIKMKSQQGKRTDLQRDDVSDGTSVQCGHKSYDQGKKGTTRDKMARRLGIATATLSKHRSIIKLPDDVIDSIGRLLDQNMVTFEAAYRMSGLKPCEAKLLIGYIDESPDKKVDVNKLKDKLKSLGRRGKGGDMGPVLSEGELREVLVPRDSK